MGDSWTKHLAALEITPPSDPTNNFQFHLFPTLPSEIRLKIWAAVLFSPRSITIKCDRPPFKRGTVRVAQAFKSNLPPPALLHVNQESRFEALNVYKPHFRTSRGSNNTYVSTRGHIYVSFEQDTLRFEQSTLPFLAETELQGIQTLVLDVKDPGYFGHFDMSTIVRMRALKKLDIWAVNLIPNYGWNNGQSYLTTLLRNFDEAKEMDPGWDCPVVRIFNNDTKLLVGNIKGGALIPGWVEENARENEDVDTAFRI